MQPFLSEDFEGLERSKPLVLLLGHIDHEGITSSLKASGEQYKKKVLDSSIENWYSILKYFDRFKIRALVVKLTPYTYQLISNPEYQQIAAELFKQTAKVRHIVFVFEDLLREGESGSPADKPQPASVPGAEPGPFSIEYNDAYAGDYPFHRPTKQMLHEVNALLREHDLNLVPYTRNAEVTVLATQFLKDALEHLLFRIYVPAGRLWAREVDRLLQLFREYLETTGRKGVRLEQIRTDRGIAYEFHGDEFAEPSSLSVEFQDFSRLLDFCLSDPQQAAAMLQAKSVDADQIAEILTRYSKEARRLQTDLRHDRERKLLSIRQRLESELAEALPSHVSWEMIGKIVESALPEASNMSVAYSVDQKAARLIGEGIKGQTIINVSQQFIETVSGIVAQEIHGDAELNKDDEHLFSLIKKYADKQSVELASSVHTLSDQDVAKASRLASAQKLKAFLFGISSHIGQAAVTVLERYIEKKLGF
jgi:hypothetical protein